MITVNGKDWKKLKDNEKIAYCESLLDDAKTHREKRDLEWYLNRMFEDGNHYLSYNTSLNTIEANPKRKRGEVRMVVNKIRSSKRAIQNYVTGDRPKWDITPGDTDVDTIDNARRLGKVMDSIYRKLHLEAMVNGVVDTGLSTSVGIVELDWDEEAEGGQGQVRVRLQDPFDVWIDRRAYLYRGRLVSSFAAKTPWRTLSSIMSDKRYDEKARKKVKADEELAVSRLKAKILRKDVGPDKAIIKGTTLKEFLLWDDDKNSKGGKLILFTYAGGQALREEELEAIDYPLYFFQISMNPLSVYQRSWIADAIPLNKGLDRTMSQKVMYANQALVYRIIADKGHGASVISNEAGEIVEINKGRRFEQMVMHPMPQGLNTLTDEFGVAIEDTLGAHDAALGRLPAGARSGKTLEALQAADANNLTGLTQSLESFLAVIGEGIIDIIADKYVASRVMKIAEPEDGKNLVKVQGKDGKLKEDVTIITKDNEVIVKIGSWLGHTLEAKRETIMKMAELGILDGGEVLRQFEFPNAEELSEKAKAQRLEQGEMDMAIAGRGQGGEGGSPQEGGTDMTALADKENAGMMNGDQIPPTEGADIVHTQGHTDFMKTDMFRSAPPEIQQLVSQHVQGEMQFHGVGGV